MVFLLRRLHPISLEFVDFIGTRIVLSDALVQGWSCTDRTGMELYGPYRSIPVRSLFGFLGKAGRGGGREDTCILYPPDATPLWCTQMTPPMTTLFAVHIVDS